MMSDLMTTILPYAMNWADLLLRWLHVIVVIAWIGSSFYFVWLDNSLEKPTDPELKARGVDGELWAVHGGGFYNPQKYRVAPKNLPQHLHWFYWESYSTWLSGFALLCVLYFYHAGIFIVDPRVFAWSSPGYAEYWIVGGGLILAVAVALAPKPQPVLASSKPVTFAEVQHIVQERCLLCHAGAAASKGVRLDSAPDIVSHAQAIYKQVVVLKAMPLNNATQMTDLERAEIGQWIKDGAKP